MQANSALTTKSMSACQKSEVLIKVKLLHHDVYSLLETVSFNWHRGISNFDYACLLICLHFIACFDPIVISCSTCWVKSTNKS